MPGPLRLRPERKDRYIFCDESGLNDRFFVLGALYCPSSPEQFRAELDAIKKEHWLRGEIKWEKFPKSAKAYLKGYNAVVDKFIDSTLSYKALIVDTHQYPLNDPNFTGGVHSIGYYQFYLTLLFHGFIRHEPTYNTRICLHIPAYKLSGGLIILEDKINEEAAQRGFPDMEDNSCCRVLESTAKENSMLQLTDILTGMVSAIWNGKIAGKTKPEFVSKCSTLLGFDITKQSESRCVDLKFNRWVFKSRADAEESKRWPALYPPTK